MRRWRHGGRHDPRADQSGRRRALPPAAATARGQLVRHEPDRARGDRGERPYRRNRSRRCSGADARDWAKARAANYATRSRSGRALSAKRSRARHDVALAAIALPAAWGSTRASTRRRSSGPARADECVRGRSSENSQVMGAITPNQPNLVAGVGRHHQQPPPGGHRLPHRGSGGQFSDNLAAKQSRDEPPGRRLFRRHCDRVVRSATLRKSIGMPWV